MKLFAFAFVPVALAASSAGAISTYQSEVPNGATHRCLTCHTRAGGNEGWNDFGQAILVAGGANPAANPNDQNLDFTGSPSDYWLDICGDDSDGDGSLNGEELNDADCDGIEDAEGALSNPGDPESTPDDPGEPGGGDDDLGAGGCAAAPVAAPAALLALLALARRRR
jgi:hypothetical protein